MLCRMNATLAVSSGASAALAAMPSCSILPPPAHRDYDLIPNKRAAVSPSIAARSASLRPGVLRM